MFNDTVNIPLERPHLADHEYGRRQRRAAMLAGVLRLGEIEQTLQF